MLEKNVNTGSQTRLKVFEKLVGVKLKSLNSPKCPLLGWHPYCLLQIRCNYRSHPKDGEGTVFTGVCLSTLGGGVPQSLVLSQVTGPRFFPQGYPSPGWGDTPVLARGYPSPGWGGGIYGVALWPCLDGVPPARTGWGIRSPGLVG